MENITVRDIVEATKGTLLCGDENTVVTDICIDSRKIKEGDLFIPIIGERVNPHRFIEQVLKVGAATLTSEHYAVSSDKPYIKVSDMISVDITGLNTSVNLLEGRATQLETSTNKLETSTYKLEQRATNLEAYT